MITSAMNVERVKKRFLVLKVFFNLIYHLEKLFLFIASGTTSNLRKHFRESKEPAHQFEWIRLTELETKNSKPNITTPIKRIQVDDRTCKSESKGFKHPHPNPKYPIFLGLKFLNFNKPLIFIYLFYFIVKKPSHGR